MTRVWAAITLALCLGCFSAGPSAPKEKGGRPDLGSVQLSSEVMGKMAISPASCRSGQRQSFLGVDFSDEKSGVVVRLVVDPLEGPAARVFAIDKPFEKSVVFRRAECHAFHFSLESTMWRINEIQDYRLTLDLDCVNKEGDSILGKLAADHCH